MYLTPKQDTILFANPMFSWTGSGNESNEIGLDSGRESSGTTAWAEMAKTDATRQQGGFYTFFNSNGQKYRPTNERSFLNTLLELKSS